jgi:predicted membrane channel-forming protein YqfA (hemolysin III family)
MTMHPKFQGRKYRLFRALMFVATGLSGLAPLIHGLYVFGVSRMMRKAFPYTLAKAACLLSGTAFYAVSLLISHTREKLAITHVVPRPGFPNVDILANSIYGAPIRSFISWWYAPLWSS